MNSYLENNPDIEQKLYETLNKGTIMEPRNYVKTKKVLQDIGCLHSKLEWKYKCRLGVHIDTLVIVHIISSEGNQTLCIPKRKGYLWFLNVICNPRTLKREKLQGTNSCWGTMGIFQVQKYVNSRRSDYNKCMNLQFVY